MKFKKDVDGLVELRYCADHLQEIQRIADTGNPQAIEVMAMIERMKQCQCRKCQVALAEAVHYYRMGRLN